MNGNRQTTDLDLLERCYRRYLCGVTCYACRYVPEDIAADIVQDVFLRLWQNNRAFFRMDDTAAQQAYLYTCVRNACRDWIKHTNVVSSHSGPMADSIRADEILWYEQFIEGEDFRRKVERLNSAVETLPDRCREIFRMHYMQQMRSAEIASISGISVRTVEAQLYKALQSLRKILRENKDK